MQSVSSRIWTRVAVSISFDDNHYTMGTSWVTVILIFDWFSQFLGKIQVFVSFRFLLFTIGNPRERNVY